MYGTELREWSETIVWMHAVQFYHTKSIKPDPVSTQENDA
jgi:hypothetical protein